ncbi:hypothetical protein [Streptomyces sp. NPDC008240]|uniref:hypothetical protein n=1 Tax=Streptomyces sp. NPDC008240 TaxID=3364822 RepID=UPI0036EE2C03
MTIEVTHPVTATTNGTQLRSYMRALSVVEQIMSQAPVMPTSVDVIVHPWAAGQPEVRFYFHRDPKSLRAFAAELLMEVSTEDRTTDEVYTEARVIAGQDVRVMAWSLSPRPVEQGVESPEVAA